MTTTACQARRESDQMRCARCGLLWDVADPEPPACPRREPTTGMEYLRLKQIKKGKAK